MELGTKCLVPLYRGVVCPFFFLKQHLSEKTGVKTELFTNWVERTEQSTSQALAGFHFIATDDKGQLREVCSHSTLYALSWEHEEHRVRACPRLTLLFKRIQSHAHVHPQWTPH